MSRIIRDGQERDEQVQFIYQLLKQILCRDADDYYKQDGSLHVSEVSHPCPLYSFYSITEKRSEGKDSRVNDPILKDWFLIVGTLVHRGLEEFTKQNLQHIKYEVEKVVLYDLERDVIADEQTKAENLLKGKIDLIIYLNEQTKEVILVDWKTTRKSKGSSFKYNPAYLSQLTLYAYILQKMGYKVKYLILVYINLVKDVSIDEDTIVVLNYDEKQAEMQLETVKKVWQGLKQNKQPEPFFGTHCFYCPFRAKCQRKYMM